MLFYEKLFTEQQRTFYGAYPNLTRGLYSIM